MSAANPESPPIDRSFCSDAIKCHQASEEGNRRVGWLPLLFLLLAVSNLLPQCRLSFTRDGKQTNSCCRGLKESAPSQQHARSARPLARSPKGLVYLFLRQPFRSKLSWMSRPYMRFSMTTTSRLSDSLVVAQFWKPMVALYYQYCYRSTSWVTHLVGTQTL